MPKRMGRLRVKRPQFYQVAAVLFGIGLLVGIFFAKGVHKSCQAETSQFFQQVGAKLEQEEKDYTALFQEILPSRLKSLGLLLLFSISALSLPYIGAFLLYKGGISGFLIGTVLFQFGTKGVLLAASLFFPQCFLYAPAYFSILSKGFRIGVEGSSQREILKELPSVFVALALLIVGCVLEAYGNAWLLGKVFSVL